MSAPRILYLEDDADLRDVLVTFLAREGFDVTAVDCAEDAMALLAKGRTFDVMLTDYRMPGENAPWLLREATARGLLAALPVIVLSSEVAPSGVDGHLFLAKPVAFPLLSASLAIMVAKGDARRLAQSAMERANLRIARKKSTRAQSLKLIRSIADHIGSFEDRLSNWAFPDARGWAMQGAVVR